MSRDCRSSGSDNPLCTPSRELRRVRHSSDRARWRDGDTCSPRSNIAWSLLFPITNSRPLRKKSWASTFLVPPPTISAFSAALSLILSAEMISCVSSSCTAKMSVRSRSKRSAQICAPLAASMSWPVTLDPVARLAHAAFQHVAHAEFATDLFHVDWLALVGKTRVAGDDAQLGQLRKIGNDVLADAVGKILLLGVSAHVVEGEDCDGRPVSRRQAASALGTRTRPYRAKSNR